ncbi:MAG: glycosyltransferase [Acutalibacteraceae bacterium]|nr:glycosyltransferase [Acutalibacteraceae bacterium]
MKKILIFSHAMELGGAERALLGLLETIDTTKYSVDLFLMRHQGELMKYIPDDVNLLPENKKYSCLAIPMKEVIKRRQFGVAFGRLSGLNAARKRVKQLKLGDNDVALEYSHKYTLRYMPQVSKEEYDLAISFLTPHYFVADKVKAKKKIAWIHTDYAFVEVDKRSQLDMWERYDNIISISDNVTESFVKTFPSLEDKIVMIENIMPMKYMRELAAAFSAEEEIPQNSINLLTIGRFSYQKRMDEIPQICKRIRESGIDAKWYLIGFGGDEALIRQRIAEAGAEDFVIILGKKENPYPYIKACDIYIQPSRYEGKSVAVREAQILGKPVIITNYATAASQLNDVIDGVIVPMDIDACADGIIKVIKNKELQEKLVENTKKTDYTNASEINKLYSIVEEC